MQVKDWSLVDSLIEKAVEMDIPMSDWIASEPCVMRSAAGWYVGQFCVERMGENEYLPMPYDRLTTYCKSPEMAQVWLDALLELEL